MECSVHGDWTSFSTQRLANLGASGSNGAVPLVQCTCASLSMSNCTVTLCHWSVRVNARFERMRAFTTESGVVLTLFRQGFTSAFRYDLARDNSEACVVLNWNVISVLSCQNLSLRSDPLSHIFGRLIKEITINIRVKFFCPFQRTSNCAGEVEQQKDTLPLYLATAF